MTKKPTDSLEAKLHAAQESARTDDSSSETAASAAPSTPAASAEGERTSTSASAQQDAMATEVLTRKRKRHHAKLKRRIRIAIIVVVVLTCIGAGVAFGMWSMLKTGEANLHQEATDIQTADTAVAYDEGRTIKHNGHTYQLNENMVSICIIGYDRRSTDAQAGHAGQADAVMVLALDTETGKATAIGLPRDSMVDVGEYVGEAFLGMDTMQLCLAFSYGDGGELSCEYTTTIAQRMLYNMPISYYLALDMNGVGALSNAIDGVALTPVQTIPNTNITEGQPTVLFGDNALKYVQWRDTLQLDSSLKRQERQIQFIKEYVSQALTSAQGDVSVLLNLFNTAQDYSITNLGSSEFTYLASCMVSNGITSLDVVTLSGEMKEGGRYAEFYLDNEAVYQTVLDVYYTQID